jgi:hypothetical protein
MYGHFSYAAVDVARDATPLAAAAALTSRSAARSPSALVRGARSLHQVGEGNPGRRRPGHSCGRRGGYRKRQPLRRGRRERRRAAAAERRLVIAPLNLKS